jgi:hypothetical protein
LLHITVPLNCAVISKRQSEPGNLPIEHFFPVIGEQRTEKYSQINLKFGGLMRVVGNLCIGRCIVLPSEEERMNSALPCSYLKMCFRHDLKAVGKLFVAPDWSGIKTLHQLILPELHPLA